MTKSADTAEKEFSLPISIDKIPPSGIEQRMEANATQRTGLAKRFGLLELQVLKARLSLTPARAGRMIAVTGRMEADVIQQCGVTLEPLPAHIEQELDVLYARPELIEEDAEGDIDDPDVEPTVDGCIDLGELLAQHLGVALDPYPRKPGLQYVEAQYGEEEKVANPFAVLSAIKKTPKK